MLTVEYNPADIERHLKRLAKLLGVTVQRVSYMKMADYTEAVMREATPPYTQAKGKRAVIRDINMLFAGMSSPFQNWVEDEELYRDPRVRGVRWNIEGTLQRMIGWHHSHRTARNKGVRFAARDVGSIGSVRFLNKMYVPRAVLTAYKKVMTSHVGRLKKSWYAALVHWSRKARIGVPGDQAWVGIVPVAAEGSHGGNINPLGHGDISSTNMVRYAGTAINQRRVQRIWQRMQRTIVSVTESKANRLIVQEGFA